MKNIIIMGTGKASLLHYQKYKKIKDIENIFVVNPYGKKFCDLKIYKNIKEVFEKNELDLNSTIVDICTPNSEFITIINDCINLNLNNIIVEKPFIVNEDYFKDKSQLNIVMVQNYLYSKITKRIEEIMNEYNLKIKSIYANFSKNRIEESYNNRGILDRNITVFEIEIPHQIYLINNFVNNCNFKVGYERTEDMIFKDKVIKNHAYGLIMCEKNNIPIIYESDLMTNCYRKEIIFNFNDNYVLNASYIIYDKNFDLSIPGYIKFFRDGEKILEEIFFDDDSVYCFLNEIFKYFNSNKKDASYKDKILEFSREINIILQHIE